MSLTALIDVMPERQADKLSVVISDTIVAVGAGQVAVYAGDAVEEHRFLEMLEGWRWLWNGLRDRNLLDITDSVTGPLYAACQINSLNEENRRTSWLDLPTFTDDIGIGVGVAVAEELSATNMVENAFTMLRDAVKDQHFNRI